MHRDIGISQVWKRIEKTGVEDLNDIDNDPGTVLFIYASAYLFKCFERCFHYVA